MFNPKSLVVFLSLIAAPAAAFAETYTVYVSDAAAVNVHSAIRAALANATGKRNPEVAARGIECRAFFDAAKGVSCRISDATTNIEYDLEDADSRPLYDSLSALDTRSSRGYVPLLRQKRERDAFAIGVSFVECSRSKSQDLCILEIAEETFGG